MNRLFPLPPVVMAPAAPGSNDGLSLHAAALIKAWVPSAAFFAHPLNPVPDDPDGWIRLAEIRRIADRLCEVMNRLSEDDRWQAIEEARSS